MIKSYVTIALRILRKQKLYAVINIAGLSVGIACSLFIFLWVRDELSYDRYHKNVDRIYRVVFQKRDAGKEYGGAMSPAPLAQALLDEFPEILQATRISDDSEIFFRFEDKGFNESRVVFADPNIFSVLTIPLILGDPRTALSKPNSVVITRSIAEKYFGERNPLGKTLRAEERRDLLVTGVAEDIPPNSHYHYDFIGSFLTLEETMSREWLFSYLYTYILLKESVDPAKLEPKLQRIVKKYMAPHYEETLGLPDKEGIKANDFARLGLQPITDIHLHSHMLHEIEPNSDPRYITIFAVIAIFILLIACINFMNLSTARSSIRAREVGMRKVLGSASAQLIRQFLVESTLMSLFSLALALALVELLLPLFNSITGKAISLPFFSQWWLLPGIIVVMLFIGVLAGIYPAFVLTSFHPISVLRGKFQAQAKHSFVRNGLVLFQFTISICLLVGTFIVYSQMQFVRNMKLGFDKEHIVIFPRAHVLEQKQEVFKQEIVKYAGIKSSSISSTYPSKALAYLAYKKLDSSSDEVHVMSTFISDHDFAKTYGLELIEGRFFSADPSREEDTVVLNETGVRLLGLEDPVGQSIFGPEKDKYRTLTVIGVIEDSHFHSLHQQIQPLGIRHLSAGGTSSRFLSIRLNPGNIGKTLSFLKSKWEEFVPHRPFGYTFLDEDLDQLYKTEWRTGQLMTAFSILSVIIACLGLFGLVAFSAEQRTKEIGIRKVLGASSSHIVFSYSKEFTKWVILANVIAWPIAFYTMSKWLENFAYRTSIELWTFVLAAVLALLISLITITFQVIRAALANPVDSIRYE
ncbi:MAG: ABC transporter permease [Candidatus Aminicenantes bacterium]|jgi:putative ABC transport system permease protein